MKTNRIISLLAAVLLGVALIATTVTVTHYLADSATVTAEPGGN